MFCLFEYLCSVCAWYPRRPEETIRSPETEVADGCELICGCRELNQGPSEDQPVILTPEHLSSPIFENVFSFRLFVNGACLRGHACARVHEGNSQQRVLVYRVGLGYQT